MAGLNEIDDNLRNAQAIANSAQGGAAAQVVVSLTPSSPTLTAKLGHLTVTSGPVIAVVSGLITIGGLLSGNSGSLYYVFTETVSAGGWIDIVFDPPLPATGPNTAITATLAAIVGGAASAVTLSGWQA